MRDQIVNLANKILPKKSKKNILQQTYEKGKEKDGEKVVQVFVKLWEKVLRKRYLVRLVTKGKMDDREDYIKTKNI